MRLRLDVAVVTLAVLAEPALASVPRTPNSVRYREATPHATGRSGNATLTARALLDRNGLTVVELTTGSFDDGTIAPGEIAKVQAKSYAGDGNLVFTRNYAGTGAGTFRLPVADLVHGQALQLQASIRGIDRRTDIVTVTEPVRLQPDLRVLAFDVPEVNMPGAPVSIEALVAEVNGDSGSLFDCVLYADGAAVDRAEGLWADAGDSVSCAFSVQFHDPGSHELRVVASARTPEWNESDNAAERTIRIVIPDGEPYQWMHAQVIDWDMTRRSTLTSRWAFSDGTGQDSETSNDFDEWTQQEIYSAGRLGQVTFPVAAINASMMIDGQAAYATTVGPVASTYQWNDGAVGGECGSQEKQIGNRLFTISVCNTRFYGSTYWNVGMNRLAGTITYYSHGWVRHWSGTPDTTTSYYSWNETWTEDATGAHNSVRLPHGTHYAFDVRLTDGGTTYALPTTLTVAPFTRAENEPEVCVTDSYGTATVTSCRWSSLHQEGVAGWSDVW